MNYIVYDLEFNQKEKNNDIPLNFEILQIGAVKLDNDLNVVSTFNTFVKPNIFPNIHPYIKELTKITEEDVNDAPDFIHAVDNFLNFIGNEKYTLCTWGEADINEFINNLNFYNIPTSIMKYNHIDIQLYASKFFKYPKGSRIGLKNTIDILNLPENSTFHNALHDAIYTAEVFKQIYCF